MVMRLMRTPPIEAGLSWITKPETECGSSEIFKTN